MEVQINIIFLHFPFPVIIPPMSHNEAIEFENAINSGAPLQSEVVARWQRRIQDKSKRQGTIVYWFSLFLNNRQDRI